MEAYSFECACVRLGCFCASSCNVEVCLTRKKRTFVKESSKHIMAAEPEMKLHEELTGITNTPVLGAGINAAISCAHIVGCQIAT